MSNDLVDRLRLVRLPGIGPVTYRQLISRFGSPAAALEAVPDLAARGGGRPPRLISQSDAEREIASLDALGGRYLVLGLGLYPRALAELDDAPPLLTVKGDLKLLERPLVLWWAPGILPPRRAGSLASLPMTWAGKERSLFRASPGASTAPRMTARSRRARSASSPEASTFFIRPRTGPGRKRCSNERW